MSIQQRQRRLCEYVAFNDHQDDDKDDEEDRRKGTVTSQGALKSVKIKTQYRDRTKLVARDVQVESTLGKAVEVFPNLGWKIKKESAPVPRLLRPRSRKEKEMGQEGPQKMLGSAVW